MEETQKQPQNKVSSVGSTSACLSVTLICICNQMKDWKAAFGLEGRTEIEQPEAHYLISTSAQCFLSMCCSPMVMFPCTTILQVKLKTQAVVWLLGWFTPSQSALKYFCIYIAAVKLNLNPKDREVYASAGRLLSWITSCLSGSWCTLIRTGSLKLERI